MTLKSAESITYEIIKDDIQWIAFDFLQDNEVDLATQGYWNMITHIILSGDRISVCDELVLAKDTNNDGKIVWMTSISSRWEDDSGKPTIVWCAVLPSYAKQGIGTKLNTQAIHEITKRMNNWEILEWKIHIDCVSHAGFASIKKCMKENPEFQDILDVQQPIFPDL